MPLAKKITTLISLALLFVSLIKTQALATQNEEKEDRPFVHAIQKAIPDEVIKNADLTPEDKDLLLKALEASKNAYCPFSGYHVGCALETEKGNFFTGCNVENDSYGLTVCSERNALPTAVAQEGPAMKLKRLAAIVINREGEIAKDGSPCGACRQFMAQFGTKAEVIYVYKGQFCKNKVDELLLNPFVIEF